METQTYTCIKPTTHQYQKITVGDEIELTPEQARPLQHGGFITFDEAAAKCIRQLAKGDEQDTVDQDINTTADDLDNEASETTSTESRRVPSVSVGYEKGD
jgi:hypothetical protein